MLSQIRQISDGNYNTVFVKNKEQKFNLDKEIHDLECWKQSRNHVYRKEERELLSHLDKLRQQQEYLHHLDEERSGFVRGIEPCSYRRHSTPVSMSLTQNASVLSPPERSSFQDMVPITPPEVLHPSRTSVHTPHAMLPPVKSGTDKRALHRTEAHTNICVICQLPRLSHGYNAPGEAVCCCEEHEGTKTLARRFTTTGHDENRAGHTASPVQVGQRRHSLMMARLNESHHEYKPHPPDRGHTGKSQEHAHMNTHQDHVHIHRHVHNHVHMPHDHGLNHHHHHGHHVHHGDHHVNSHVGNTHGPHDSHRKNSHSHYSTPRGSIHHSGHAHHGGYARGHTHGGHRGSGHVNDHHRHHHHSNSGETHTPNNSPRRYSRQSSIHDPNVTNHEHMFPHHTAHHYYDRRQSMAGGLGPSGQDSDARTRDHELHWDRHQVCKLKGMITDPHYKEQLEVENGRSYPWSGLYPPNKARVEDIEELKNCRYLRFSKLNLMNMKENPEEEVEVFENNYPPM